MKSILAQRLRAARLALVPEVTQRDVAKRLNLSPSAINLWEAGKTEPSASTLVELAKWFRVSVDWLLGLEADTKGALTVRENVVGWNTFSVPVLDAEALLRWRLDGAREFVQTTTDYPAPTAAAVRVTDSALASVAPMGALAVISNADAPAPECIVLATIGKRPVLRRLVQDGGTMILIADDPRWPTHAVDSGVRIIGQAVEIITRNRLI